MDNPPGPGAAPSLTQDTRTRTILFCAGDLSGDVHMALLAGQIARRHPNWTLHALGGDNLRQVVENTPGGSLVGDTRGCGVIGLAAAWATVPRVLKLRRRLVQFLDSHVVDAIVLCDWGAFNGRLLPELHRRKIPTLYYFPPRSWQKTGSGGLHIAPLVTRVATPFPWSAERLQAAGAKAEWVGHPLLEIVSRTSRDDARARLGLADGQKLIALMPGSRALELRYIAPHLAEAVRLLQQAPGGERLVFVAAVPPGSVERTRPIFPENVRIQEGDAASLLVACDAAIVKSGTATLEAAVAGAPQVVVYDVPPIMRAQWTLTGLEKKIPFIAMPNIILGRKAVPELKANDCKADRIVDEVKSLLQDEERVGDMRRDYEAVKRVLGSELAYTATQRTATILEEMLL